MVDVGAKGVSGKDAEKLLEKRRADRQQEHDPLRHALADGRLRHPHRDARGDDARHGRRRRWRRSATRSRAPSRRREDAAVHAADPAHRRGALRGLPARVTRPRGGRRRGRPVARARAREPVVGGAAAARARPGRIRAEGARGAAARRVGDGVRSAVSSRSWRTRGAACRTSAGRHVRRACREDEPHFFLGGLPFAPLPMFFGAPGGRRFRRAGSPPRSARRPRRTSSCSRDFPSGSSRRPRP